MFRTAGNYFREKLRSWLRVPDPYTPPTVVEEAKSKGISISQLLLARAGEKNVVHRPFMPPALPSNVIGGFTYNKDNDPGLLGPNLALDSELNAPSYAYANQFNCGLGFPGYAYLAELSQRSEYRAPSETIAKEMTREFIELIVKGNAKKDDTEAANDAAIDDEVTENANSDGATGNTELADKIEKLTEALEKFKVQALCRKMALDDGLFGRAQIFIDIDQGTGRDADEMRQLPLVIDSATIPKGSLRGFKAVEPIWTTPYSYNATDPMADDFYVPKAWFVLGKRIHASRLLTFIMRPVPDILKPSYNFGGLSMSQLMEPSVFLWLRTRNSVSDLVHNFSVMVLKTSMGNILSGDPDKPGGLMDRVKFFTATRDNQALTVLDKDTEELDSVDVPIAGLHELQAQAQEQMAAPSHIPLVKLLGISPGGLNASSEGEIKVFYDFVRADQQSFYAEHLNTMLQILQLHLFGAIDDAIGFKFIPLSSPTVKELAEIRKADAETAGVYVDKSIVSPDEVRAKLSSDPESGYDNLSGPAPEPMQLPEGEGMEATHALGEESAQAAHERSMEAAKAAEKTKKAAA